MEALKIAQISEQIAQMETKNELSLNIYNNQQKIWMIWMIDKAILTKIQNVRNLSGPYFLTLQD